MPTPAPRTRIKRISIQRRNFFKRLVNVRLAMQYVSRRIIIREQARPVKQATVRPSMLQRTTTCLFLLAALFAATRAVADVREERMIGPGVRYSHLQREAGPWEIYVVEI